MYDSSRRLDQVIEETGKLRHIPNLRLSPEGTAAVQFRSGVRLLFEHIEARDKLFLYTPLAPLPTDPRRRAALLESMLEANFLKLHTGAGELSVLREQGQAVYQIELDITGLEATHVSDAIDTLLRQRDDCLYHIVRWKPAHAEPALQPKPRPGTFPPLNRNASPRRGMR